MARAMPMGERVLLRRHIRTLLEQRNLYIKHAAEDGRHREYLGKQSY
jgi:hypothetical protein